jgi:N-acetyl-anhydromuramyl-L-alanine amidase AmpD
MINETVVHRIGSRGPEVGNLQRFLSDLGYRDPEGMPLEPDETFGAKTAYALEDYQKTTALPLTGEFDHATRVASVHLGFVPFVQAVHCRVFWPKRRTVRQIVIHTMECQESSLDAAENVALWFAGKTAPMASAHYMVDRDSVVQGVRDTDEAWHASQANVAGIGIEHAGLAAQTAEDWEDPASSAILLRSARLTARLCRLYEIPAARLSDADILSGRPGFCGHVDVNRAYNNLKGHVDPGYGWPWASYLALVQENI